MRAGSSRISRATTGTAASAASATVREAQRQPWLTASVASTGRKTSWPVAPAAVRIPMTSPRRATNQRFATVAASTPAIEPVPVPTTNPQSKSSCQGCRMAGVKPTPTAIRRRAMSRTRRTPKRAIKAAVLLGQAFCQVRAVVADPHEQAGGAGLVGDRHPRAPAQEACRVEWVVDLLVLDQAVSVDPGPGHVEVGAHQGQPGVDRLAHRTVVVGDLGDDAGLDAMRLAGQRDQPEDERFDRGVAGSLADAENP